MTARGDCANGDGRGMGMTEDHALAYAREVYAACLTVGFTDDHVAGLKRLLDLPSRGPEQAAGMLALARAVQAASVAWASRPGLS